MQRTIIGWHSAGRKAGQPIYLIQGGSAPAGEGGTGGAGTGAGSAGNAGAPAGAAGTGGTGSDPAGSAGGSGTGGGTTQPGGNSGAGSGNGQPGAPAGPGPASFNLDPVALQQLAALGWTAPNVQPGSNAGASSSRNDGLPDYGHQEALQEIVRLRGENNRDRQVGKTGAQNEVHQVYAHLIGSEPKPEAITARLGELVGADTRARSAELRLAVYVAASSIGADATRLLDSQAFMAGLQGLTPDGSDALTAKIRETADKDPMYRTGNYRPVGANGQPPAGSTVQTQFRGTSTTPNGKPATLSQALDKLYS